jgi:hypothetical protein
LKLLTTNGKALLDSLTAGDKIPIVSLVKIDFQTATVYLTTAGHRIQFAGQNWEPAGLGQIEEVSDSDQDIAPLRLSMPGLTPAQKVLALESGTEGSAIRIYDALINPLNGLCEDAVQSWSGTLNVPTLQEGETAVLSVTAEHRGVSALRVKPSRYTNDEQQRLYPGDSSMDIDPMTDGAPLVWPAASYGRI